MSPGIIKNVAFISRAIYSKLLEGGEKNSHFLTKINKNKDSWIMCYPYGNYNETVIKHLKKWDYRAGLTIEPGDTLLSEENAFELQRWDTNDFPQ